MLNIIRSLTYFVKRDPVLLLTLFTCLVFPFVNVFVSGADMPFSDVTGSVYAIGHGADMGMFLMFGIMVLTTRISGTDCADKTINYELMMGHSRVRAYYARVLVSGLVGGGLLWIISLLPLGLLTLLNGWGSNGDMFNILLRAALSLLPFLRMATLFSVMTLVLGGFGKGLVFSFLFFDMESLAVSMIEEYTSFRFGALLGYSDIQDMLLYNNCKSVVVDGHIVNLYETGMAPGRILASVIGAVISILIISVAGCIWFRRKDRQ
ncbi:MAG: hypothetical protein J5825_09010 [Lachnospiraceae bacterium]|nr:hypothetical protein [Lachnospiraceae bacterium]